MSLDETAVRKDLERTAREILSRKTWSVPEAAKHLGYSKNNMYIVLDKRGCMIKIEGGRQHVYGIDVFEIFSGQCGYKFEKLAAEWCVKYNMYPTFPL